MRFVQSYIENIARDFWSQIRPSPTPPYDISGAVSLMLPVDIVCLSDLSLKKIEQWLTNRNLTFKTDVNDRCLHGFILIYSGTGFIFINGTDSEEERRYTIAHEVSHFILDYKIPRDKAIDKLGIPISDVLDGLREPSIQERVDGVINGVSVQLFTHILEKDGDGSFLSIKVFNAENNADSLALELLAPHSIVTKETMAGKKKMQFAHFEVRCYTLLTEKYKLPQSIAKQYAKSLSYSVTGGPSITNKLGF